MRPALGRVDPLSAPYGDEPGVYNLQHLSLLPSLYHRLFRLWIIGRFAWRDLPRNQFPLLALNPALSAKARQVKPPALVLP